MNFPPTHHTFIVRFWLEKSEIPDRQPEWRGMIENVLTKEKRYFLRPEQIMDFIFEKIAPEHVKAEE